MAGAQLEMFLRKLRRALRPPTGEAASDAQLLSRFVQQRDQEAFELLIWRHGLMVLNVCRRVLRHEHDAEDAFQATFLTLARKAADIGKRESMGSWLYKVAYRIALRAKKSIPMQSLAEEPPPDPSSREPINDLLCHEFSAAVDEEIQRLPEKYRAALVLCYLEGQTIDSAAGILDCPAGTVGTWLARARTLLRRRLVRRGFDLSDAAGARNIVAVISAALVDSTVQAAVCGMPEQAVAAGMISASAAALTKGALQAMSLTRWTATAVMVLALSSLGGGGAFLAHRVRAVEPAQASADPEPRNASPKERQPSPVIFRWKFKKGQPFYQIVSNQTMQNMNVMNNDVMQKQEQTFYLRWTPLEQKGGKWTMEMKIVGIKMDIDIGGAPIRFDSTVASKAHSPLADFFKTTIGAEFQLVLDAETLAVLRIARPKEFDNKRGAAIEQSRALLDRFYGDEALKEMARVSFPDLLMGPARPGDSWIKRQRMDKGPIGASQKQYQCKYEGTESKQDKIAVKITANNLSSGEQKGVGGANFRIAKKNLSGNGTGFLYFDRTNGCLARSMLSVTWGGTLTIEIGGQDTQVDLLQTEQTSVRTLYANPIEAAPLPKENEPLREENERLRKDNEQLRRRLQDVEKALRREDSQNK